VRHSGAGARTRASRATSPRLTPQRRSKTISDFAATIASQVTRSGLSATRPGDVRSPRDLDLFWHPIAGCMRGIEPLELGDVASGLGVAGCLADSLNRTDDALEIERRERDDPRAELLVVHRAMDSPALTGTDIAEGLGDDDVRR